MDSIVSGFGHLQGGWALINVSPNTCPPFSLFFSIILDGYLQDTHWVSEEKKFNFSYSSHQGKPMKAQGFTETHDTPSAPTWGGVHYFHKIPVVGLLPYTES
jgi:hypothetical protein